jgi:hypothetical protein
MRHIDISEKVTISKTTQVKHSWVVSVTLQMESEYHSYFTLPNLMNKWFKTSVVKFRRYCPDIVRITLDIGWKFKETCSIRIWSGKVAWCQSIADMIDCIQQHSIFRRGLPFLNRPHYAYGSVSRSSSVMVLSVRLSVRQGRVERFLSVMAGVVTKLLLPQK